MSRKGTTAVGCDNCGGTGRLARPGRLGPICPMCEGSGVLMIHGSDSGLSWARETSYGKSPMHEMRDVMSHLGYEIVEVPVERPSHLICGDQNDFKVDSSYTVEVPHDDLILTYTGVPVEDHDCIPGKKIVRLDRALSVSARRQ